MRGSLTTHFSDRERSYTGEQLRPHFLLSEVGIRGSGIAAFIGPCQVKTEHLVDWEDRLAQDRIEAKSMIHFIGEFFGASLPEGVLLQRLFMAHALETVRDMAPGVKIRRTGDDLFVATPSGEKKLSVSIVTASPVSQLLHVGINIDPQGAPVAAIGLAELKIDPRLWIGTVLGRFSEEWAGLDWACVKVRPVL